MKLLSGVHAAHPLLQPHPTSCRLLAACAIAALLLGACTSTPLPPWPTQNARIVPPPRAKTAAPLPSSSTGQAATSPVVSTPVTGLEDSPSATTVENDAVAAHFPDPPVRYDTPGLQPDRRAWTTNAELTQWLNGLANAPAARTNARTIELGTSQDGTPILALALSSTDSTKPLGNNERPTVLLLGGQHGDEPASTEALLVMARELSQGLLQPLLQNINVIVLPRANPDGASASSHDTSDGTDLDKDHLALRTPEARAIAQLIRTYRPAVITDVHEYPVHPIQAGNAQWLPAYDVLLQPATTANLPEFINKAALQWFVQPIFKSLDADKLTHEWLHTLTAADGTLTAETGGAQPVSLRNLGGLNNAVSLELSSRGTGLGRAHIQRRVHSLIVALSSVLRSSAERSGDLRQVQTYVARDIASKACQGTITVQASPTTTQRDLSLVNAATGELATLKARWTTTESLRPEIQRPRPCGYWLSVDSPAAARLGLLGLQVMRVAEEGSVLSESFQDDSESAAPAQAVRTTVDIPAGSYFVGLNQPLASIAEAALEPGTPFDYQSNGIITDPATSARVINNPSLVFDESE